MFATRFCEAFSVKLPIVQAGMAGGITSPELVAAVSEAGGLGTLAGAYVKPDALRQSIREVKQLTNKPFGVNLLLFEETTPPEVSGDLVDWLNKMRQEVGLTPWSGELPQAKEDLDECFAVIVEEQVPVFSCAFQPPGKYGKAAKQAGMKLIGMATTLEEARILRQENVDAIVAQGGEAGGHRGTFQPGKEGDGACIGTMPLVSLVAESLPDVPIIAAGGIMDGRGLLAALSLGADAVQMGTRFLVCRESLAHPAYQEQLLKAMETDTTVTRAFSGRPARGLNNRLIESARMEQLQALPYPVQNALTREIRAAAARLHKSEYMSLWAGQGVAMLRQTQSAIEIVNDIMDQANSAWKRMLQLRGDR